MRIEHIALWTKQIEAEKEFYERYFGAAAGPRYAHAHDSFCSYFLSFADGCRLEIMQLDTLAERPAPRAQQSVGLTHFAVEVSTRKDVDGLAARLLRDGYDLEKQPSTTGDGYYEFAVYDPDGNIVEVTAAER